ncbi:hypothetical protein SNEBB_002005 [Seison nebaliae]|nr:hypothetical protein SNEBB_002005 [Seison nebaliae]
MPYVLITLVVYSLLISHHLIFRQNEKFKLFVVDQDLNFPSTNITRTVQKINENYFTITIHQNKLVIKYKNVTHSFKITAENNYVIRKSYLEAKFNKHFDFNIYFQKQNKTMYNNYELFLKFYIKSINTIFKNEKLLFLNFVNDAAVVITRARQRLFKEYRSPNYYRFLPEGTSQLKYIFEFNNISSNYAWSTHFLDVGDEFLKESKCSTRIQCKNDEMSIEIITGSFGANNAILCINGQKLMSKSLKNIQRGLNLALLNSRGQWLITNFDSYGKFTSSLDLVVLSFDINDLLIVFSYDEASANLLKSTKSQLSILGSKLINRLRFRDTWIFIQQINNTNFNNFETLNHNKTTHISHCVKNLLKEEINNYHGSSKGYEKKVKLCEDIKAHFPSFCTSQLELPPVISKRMTKKSITEIPILFVAGLSANRALSALHSIAYQPQSKLHSLIVSFHDTMEWAKTLLKMFKVKLMPIPNMMTYTQLYMESIKQLLNNFPDDEHFIIIRSDVILGPNTFMFFADLFTEYENDESIIGIDTWNPNSHRPLMGDPLFVHRANAFSPSNNQLSSSLPSNCYLTKRTFLQHLINDAFVDINKDLNLDDTVKWTSDLNYDIYVPDISRIMHYQPLGYDDNEEYLRKLFNQPRRIFLTIQHHTYLRDILSVNQYFTYLLKLESKSKKIDDVLQNLQVLEDFNRFCQPKTLPDNQEIHNQMSNHKSFVIFKNKLEKELITISKQKHLHIIRIEYKHDNELMHILHCFNMFNYLDIESTNSSFFTNTFYSVQFMNCIFYLYISTPIF